MAKNIRTQKDKLMLTADLPAIPKKRYFTIGEVSKLCDVRAHVLRYWEVEFPKLDPTKRAGNRRYYQHKDIELIRQIRHLLYEQRYTINGARQKLFQSESPTERLVLPKMDETQLTMQVVALELENVVTLLEEGVGLE